MRCPNLATMAESQLLQLIQDIWPLVPTYAHLLVSAIFPIYAGAHASLYRPSSAAKSTKQKSKDDENDVRDDEDDEEDDEFQRMEGLSPSDALVFPLMAGCTLAGLYFLIKWLQDPTLLNKILNAYFAVFGAVSVARLLADAFGFIECMIFPSIWVDRNGTVWSVKSKDRLFAPTHKGTDTKTSAVNKTSPLPGLLSSIKLPRKVTESLWFLRELPQHKWTIQLYVQHMVSGKVHIGINGFIGIVLSILAVMYFNLIDKPWWLTNLMGFGFSYGALQLLSPTTFSTGALILSALFFYDIYFVFYTPMMVTVAKSLDIPIKLLFPRPAAPGEAPEVAKRTHAMLGLGDVVLPGIMIGLALRFDLFMHYLRKQTKTGNDKANHVDGSKDSAGSDSASTRDVIKSPYTSLSGKYGDAFWTHSWFGQSLLPGSAASNSTAPDKTSGAISETSFPKPYFHASIAGYLTGLLMTLSIMHVFGHAQPALLYLVPGVLLSLLLTGAIRGEMTAMWDYTELEEEEQSGDGAKEGDSNPSESGKGADSTEKAVVEKKSKEEKKESEVELVKVGEHQEKALIKFSISRRDFGGRSKSQDAKESVDDVDDDNLRRSPRLKAVDESTGGGRPSKRSRVA